MPATNIRIALGSGNDMSGLGRILVPAICTMGPDGQGVGLEDIVCARASKVTGINALGQIVTYPANTPSYNNGNLQSLPVAGWTNYHPYSYDVSNWTDKIRLNVTSPTLVADPAGTTRGFPFTPSTDTSTHYAYREVNGLTDDTVYTYQQFVKPNAPVSGQSKVWARLTLKTKSGSYPSGYFNITDVLTGSKTATDSGIDGPYADGWYRIWITNDIVSGGATPAVYTYIAESDDDSAFAGDNSTPSFWAYGTNVVEGTAPLPDIVTNGDVGVVAGQTLTADISTNTALRDALSGTDAYDTDGAAIFTMLLKIIPRVSFSSYSSGANILTLGTTLYSFLYTAAITDDFRYHDVGTGAIINSYDGDADPVAGTEQWIKLTSDSTAAGGAGLVTISDSSDNGVTWNDGESSVCSSDVTISDYLYIGYGNPYAFDFGGIAFFNSVLTNAEASRAFSLI